MKDDSKEREEILKKIEILYARIEQLKIELRKLVLAR